MLDPLLNATLERLLNTAFALDPDSAARLAPLGGRRIGLELTGLGRVILIPGEGRLRVEPAEEDDEPDCWIRGTPLALLKLSRDDGRDALFEGEVQLEGDAELARRFGDLLGDLEIDWEEPLSRITGDLAATRIGNGLRGLHAWGRQTLTHLGMDMGEYLQEEIRLLPTRFEVEEFLGQVDEIRDHCERLAARIDRLRTQRDASSA